MITWNRPFLLLQHCAFINETLIFLFDPSRRMKTSQVKFDWEIVNKEETHNRSDNSDESRKRKFGAENADDSSQNHEKNIEYSYLFGCDFTVENLNEAKS